VPFGVAPLLPELRPASNVDIQYRTAGVIGFDGDVMLWFNPSRRTPVTTAVPTPVGAAITGVGDTLGDDHLSRHVTPGARIGLGYWWVTDNPWIPGGKLITAGVEARFLFVGQRSASTSDYGSPTLIRPFFDLNNSVLSGVVVATPGLATGFLSATASESLWGAEANLWKTLYHDWPGTTCSVEGMVGFRYLCMDDGIHLNRFSSFAANPVGFPDYAFLAGNQIREQESFATHNQFFGGQAGVRGNLFFDSFILTGQAQLGVGGTNESITIQGSQVRTLPGGQAITSPGALLALPSNIGHHDRTKFSFLPEVGFKLAFPVNSHVTLAAGFTTLYWNRTIRPANQVDRAVDITQIPSFPGAAAAAPTGLGRPGVPFNQSDLWLMGGMISMEVKW
jgi:hypothetical protein